MWLWLLTACVSEVGFTSLASPERPLSDQVEGVSSAPPQVVVTEPIWVPAPAAGGAVSVRVEPTTGRREDRFRVGADEPVPTDVLFVIDGSSSMQVSIEGVRQGMAALAREPGAFPPGTRVAVTTMSPSAPHDASRAHPALSYGPVVERAPGFVSLIDEDGLRRWRSNAVGLAPMPLVGGDAWFDPSQAVDGVPCLVSHTQILGLPVKVEAGMVSLAQLLRARPDTFRPGASVNVVFVSDTHDPGIEAAHELFDALDAMRPDAAELEALASAETPLAAFRVHAIAPKSACADEAFPNQSYHEAASATGGVSLDLCVARPADYVAWARSLARTGTRPLQPVVALSAPAEDVESVTLDGVPIGYSFSMRGGAVLLDGELPSASKDVRVRYRSARAVVPR